VQSGRQKNIFKKGLTPLPGLLQYAFHGRRCCRPEAIEGDTTMTDRYKPDANGIIRTECEGLTLVAYPVVVHTNTGTRHDQGCIGQTQRIETYDGDTLLSVERVEFWYTAGRLTHMDVRPVRHAQVAA
jgi:hypothetical protein